DPGGSRGCPLGTQVADPAVPSDPGAFAGADDRDPRPLPLDGHLDPTHEPTRNRPRVDQGDAAGSAGFPGSARPAIHRRPAETTSSGIGGSGQAWDSSVVVKVSP